MDEASEHALRVRGSARGIGEGETLGMLRPDAALVVLPFTGHLKDCQSGESSSRSTPRSQNRPLSWDISCCIGSGSLGSGKVYMKMTQSRE